MARGREGIVRSKASPSRILIRRTMNCMLSAHDPYLAAALEHHVQVLAGDIGERNVFRPDALHAAADYIAQEWAKRGCAVMRQDYQVRGVPCANIEVALAGCVQADEIIVLGAH